MKLREESIKQKNLLNKITSHRDLLVKENTYLATTNKDLQKISVEEVLKIKESNLFEDYKKCETENIELKKKCFIHETEAKTLNEKISEYESFVENEKKNYENRLEDFKTKYKASIQKYIEDNKNLKEQLDHKESLRNDTEKTLETSKKDLDDHLKSQKRIVDELETMKKVTGKRISQLESTISSKNDEISRLSSESPIILSKLVKLIQKSLKTTD